MSELEDGPPRAELTRFEDVLAAVRADSAFAEFEVARVERDAADLRCPTGTTAFLAMPTVWREPAVLQARVGHLGSAALLVCLGEDAELAAAATLRATGAPFVCISLPTTAGVLAAELGSALDLLARKHKAEQLGQLAERYRYELSELFSIASAINSERDINKLLGLILEKSRYVTSADAGSVYVVVPHPEKPGERALRFEVAQNESMAIDFKAFTLEVSRRSIVGAAVLRREVINIPDLYQLAADNPLGLVHDRSFDERTGYHTHSVLTVPLITQRDEVIGVLQLINKKRTPGRVLRRSEDFVDVVPFDERAVELCRTLASQAAISLENALLYEELRRVFEGFVDASVQAIEARDPTTSGHSRRVAALTVGLAESVDHAADGLYADVKFSPQELKEIHYAGLLHDFGKIGVPEPVLLKSEKLYDWELQLLISRFDYIRVWTRSETLRQRLELVQRAAPPTQLQALEVALQKQEDYLDFCIQTVLAANQPTVLEERASELLREIGAMTYVDLRGEKRTYLTQRELDCLGIRRGSLNLSERQQIESHVVHTFRFLCTIPWGRTFEKLPLIAGDHHEKLDGTGYPSGKMADDIPIQARMMAIADIYDALTASDRPYKRAVPTEKALAIIGQEVKAGKLDAHLYQIFVEAGVFRLVSK